MTKTEIFCVQGQAAMWVWVLWTSPVPIWPKQRSLVCRDKLLCGFESFEPHQYQYDQNGDVLCAGTNCYVGLSPLNLTSTNMTKTKMFCVQGQAAMWVWVLWTSPVPIWPKRRCFVCRDKLLCGFESFEPHQYQYDQNGDVVCAGTSCYVGLSPLNLTSTNMTKTEIFSVQGQAAMWVWVLWTSPVPIWPKQRSLVCRDNLLCGFESFEPHQYQYDQNRDL